MTSTTTTSTTSTLDAARAYLKRGWAVVPIPPGEKGPAVAGWPDLRVTVEDLPRQFANGVGVGIILGDASGGLVDVDLDAPEAVLLASTFLPATNLMHGRPGKSGSHQWYRLSSAVQAKQFRDLHGRMLVELRTGPGQQTMVPPSRHPSGEVLRWELAGDPEHVDGADLHRAVSRLAAAALLVRAWPQPGSRHETTLALAGALQRHGWSEDDTCGFVRVIAEAAGDEEARKRPADIRTTARRLAAGQPATGLPMLVKLLGKDVVERVAEWLELHTRANGAATAGPQKQADILVQLAGDAGFFHTPDGSPYASIRVGDHRETWPVRSRGFTRWLASRYFAQEETAPSTQAIQDALAVLEGRALFAGPTIPVFVRLAELGGDIFLDLGDAEWRAVHITRAGWQVVNEVPVRFRRTAGMLALPVPIPGGSVGELRRFLNLDESAFMLFVSTLIAALRPRGPYPIPILKGEQGSAKSTTARVWRGFVDPNTAALRSSPREERDLVVSAKNGWILAFDNLSPVQPWLSDALCRLSSGGGYGTRTLFTDEDETLFSGQRPIILNGITDIAVRPDLLDRAVILRLEPIPEDRRISEEEFWTAFEEARPRILGAVLDAVSAALKALPTVRLGRHPRMADFARWSVAAAPALGWSGETFLKTYAKIRTESHELAIEAAPIGPHLLELAEQGWTGTVGSLYKALHDQADEHQRRQPGWPKSVQAVRSALQVLAADLRAIGVEVQRGHRTKTGVPVTIRKNKVGTTSSSFTPSTFGRQDAGSSGEDAGADGDARRRSTPPSTPLESSQDAAPVDGVDGEDPVPSPFSRPEGAEEVVE